MLNHEYLTLLNLIIKKDSAGMEELLEATDLDFDDFSKFVRESHLAGTVYSVLINSELKDLFPSTLIQGLKPSYLMQWTKNENLIKEIEILSELFDGAGIEVVFLKGPFLAERFYGNIDSRAISDIDILVREEEIDYADSLLRKNGFERTSGVFLNKSLCVHFTHHFEYIRGAVDLELHWALATHSSFNLDYDRIWGQKNGFKFGKKHYWVLSDEYELVFQILTIFKDIELGTFKLKSVVDAYMILKGVDENMKWQEFLGYRRTEGLGLISFNTLDLVLSLLDCRDEFNELSACIDQNHKYLTYSTKDEKMRLLGHQKFALRNKSWAFRLYDTSLFNVLLWWSVSLPFRLIVYKKSTSRLLEG
jgi:hypothetical protein